MSKSALKIYQDLQKLEVGDILRVPGGVSLVCVYNESCDCSSCHYFSSLQCSICNKVRTYLHVSDIGIKLPCHRRWTLTHKAHFVKFLRADDILGELK